MKFFVLVIALLQFVQCSNHHHHRHDSHKRISKKYDYDTDEEVVLRKTQLERYVGMAPAEEDFDTDSTPSCSLEDEEEDQGIFPLITNTGNTCAFDSLLQTLLILEFKPFKRLNVCKSTDAFTQALVKRFGGEKEGWIQVLLFHLRAFSRKFEVYYEKDRPRLEIPQEMVNAHLQMFSNHYNNNNAFNKKNINKIHNNDRMADPSEVADFFLEMLNEEEAQTLEWRWTTVLDGRERAQESTKMLILRATREYRLTDILDRHLNHNAHQVEWRDDKGQLRLVEKKSVFTKIPHLQIFLLQRTWRPHQRLSINNNKNKNNKKSLIRTNFLSQRSIQVPLHLPNLDGSSFKAAICVNTKSVPHYFVVLRDVDPEDGVEYFTVYDGIRRLPKVIPTSYARVLINRMSLMLFFTTPQYKTTNTTTNNTNNQTTNTRATNTRTTNTQTNNSRTNNQTNSNNQTTNNQLHYLPIIDDFVDEEEYLAFVIQTLGQ